MTIQREWIDAARKRYPEFHNKHYVTLRKLASGEHQIIMFVGVPYDKGTWLVQEGQNRDPHLPSGHKRDASGVVVLEEGKSWNELKLK